MSEKVTYGAQNMTLQTTSDGSGIECRKMTEEPSSVSFETFWAGLVVALHEWQRSYAKFPRRFTSMHEGLSIIEEEFFELKTECYQQTPNHVKVLREAVQVAAMALRFLSDVCGIRQLAIGANQISIHHAKGTFVREGGVLGINVPSFAVPTPQKELPDFAHIMQWAMQLAGELSHISRRAGDRLTMDEGNILNGVARQLTEVTSKWVCQTTGHKWVADGPNVKRCGRCGEWA